MRAVSTSERRRLEFKAVLADAAEAEFERQHRDSQRQQYSDQLLDRLGDAVANLLNPSRQEPPM